MDHQSIAAQLRDTNELLYAPLEIIYHGYYSDSISNGYNDENAKDRALIKTGYEILQHQLVCLAIKEDAILKCQTSDMLKKLSIIESCCLFHKLGAAQCARRAILFTIARSLKNRIKKATIKGLGLLKRRDGVQIFPRAEFENFAQYLNGELIYDDTEIVVKFSFDNNDYFGVWKYITFVDNHEPWILGKKSQYDTFYEKCINSKTQDELVGVIYEDFRKKFISGQLFKSIDELMEYSNGLLLDGIKTYQQKSAVASPSIQALILANEPLTLRDIINATGNGDMTTDAAFELGKYVCKNLDYKENRKKQKVIRNGNEMTVSMYTPDEFSRMEYLIGEWKKNN
jgi:hypothetical protein